MKQASLGPSTGSGAPSLGIDWGDDARLASRRLHKTADGTNLSLLSYAYDNDDNITGITDGLTPANDVAYTYDVRGRLSQVGLAATSAAPFKRTDYAHDANSTSVERRVNVSDSTQPMTYICGSVRIGGRNNFDIDANAAQNEL